MSNTDSSRDMDTSTDQSSKQRELSTSSVKVKEESPEPDVPSAPKLITSGTKMYPMPTNCRPQHPDFRKNREEWQNSILYFLKSARLHPEKVLFRDDGIAVDWRSSRPVWSDTLKPEVASPPHPAPVPLPPPVSQPQPTTLNPVQLSLANQTHSASPSQPSQPAQNTQVIDLTQSPQDEHPSLPLSGTEYGYRSAPGPPSTQRSLPANDYGYSRMMSQPQNPYSSFPPPAPAPPAPYTQTQTQTQPAPGLPSPLTPSIAHALPNLPTLNSPSPFVHAQPQPQHQQQEEPAPVQKGLLVQNKLAQQFLSTYTQHFDHPPARRALLKAYASNAHFSLRLVDPSAQSSAASRLFFGKLQPSSSSPSTAERYTYTGATHIASALLALGPFVYYPRNEQLQLEYDFLELPSMSSQAEERALLTVHGVLTSPNYAQGPEHDLRLSFSHVFVLQRSDGEGAGAEGEKWPMVAVAHQMVVRDGEWRRGEVEG